MRPVRRSETTEAAMAVSSDRIVLTERATARVLELLENPPKPTSALIAAARRRVARTYLVVKIRR